MVSLKTARQLALSFEEVEEQPHFEKPSLNKGEGCCICEVASATEEGEGIKEQGRKGAREDY